LQGQIELIEEDVTAMLGDTDRNARTERGTSAWWAQNVLAAKNNLRRCMESKPPKLNDIAFAALALGKTWTAAWVSTTHESDALRGKQTVQSASEGGKEAAKIRRSRKEARNQDLQRRADEIWARSPQLSIAAVSKLLAREPGSGVGFETIRRVIRKETR
jgi:hypothetical protein